MGIVTTLSGALNYAIEPLNYIQANPCKMVKYPKYSKENAEEIRFILTQDDMKRIIERFPADNQYHLPIMIGYYTGLRISEVFGLTWDDIDMENRTITVNKITVKRNFGVDVRQVLKMKGKKEEKSAWYFGTPKTESSNRTINFGDSLYRILQTAKLQQKKNRVVYGEYYTEIVLKEEKDEKNETIHRLIEIERSIQTTFPKVEMVCVRENGQMVTSDSFKYASRLINHDLGIKFNFHSLRHTHATILVENNANIKDVQERLGHSKLETTMDTYVHNTDALRTQSVDIFEKNATLG